MSTEVGNAVDVVRKQAQALMESVNQLIAVVKEPEIQQALIEVQQVCRRCWTSSTTLACGTSTP